MTNQPNHTPDPMPRHDERYPMAEQAQEPTDVTMDNSSAQFVPMQPLRPYAAQHYQPRPQIAPKNPGLALVASFFIPGLGSLINGQAPEALAIFACWLFAWLLLLLIWPIGVLGGTAVWVWGMWHGYTGAKKWNTAHGIVS